MLRLSYESKLSANTKITNTVQDKIFKKRILAQFNFIIFAYWAELIIAHWAQVHYVAYV